MGKKILFIRHGKAETINPDITDFERSLTTKGKTLTEYPAEDFKIITSPAFRAVETAYIVAEHLSYAYNNILIRGELYFSSDNFDLITFLEKFDDSIQNIVLVGHNPLFTELVYKYSIDFSNNMPKSSVVGLHFITDSWIEIKPHTGELLYFIKPKELI